MRKGGFQKIKIPISQGQKRLLSLKKEKPLDIDPAAFMAKLPADIVKILNDRTDEAVAALRDRFD